MSAVIKVFLLFVILGYLLFGWLGGCGDVSFSPLQPLTLEQQVYLANEEQLDVLDNMHGRNHTESMESLNNTFLLEQRRLQVSFNIACFHALSVVLILGGIAFLWFQHQQKVLDVKRLRIERKYDLQRDQVLSAQEPDDAWLEREREKLQRGYPR